MKLVLFAALSNAVLGTIQDIGVHEGSCNTCMAGAQPSERATFNPMCINDRGGRGCVQTTKPHLGSQFNGCQFCAFGAFSDIPCENQFCSPNPYASPIYAQNLLVDFPKVTQALQSYADLYSQSPALAQQKLQQWKVTHPETVQMFQTFAQTWATNPEQARIQLQQWKAIRPELFQMLVSQHVDLDNSRLDENSLKDAYPMLAKILQSYADFYSQSPDLAQQKLQQWEVTHPELVQMFQKYAQSVEKNPEQAQIQLMQWKTTRPELFKMLQMAFDGPRRRLHWMGHHHHYATHYSPFGGHHHHMTTHWG